MPSPTRSKKLGPWTLGVNNRLPDTQLVSRDGAFLRSGTNVDVTTAGTIKRRPGTTRMIAGTDCHSLWTGDGITSYFVDYDTLKKVVVGAGGLVATTLRTGLTPGAAMSFTEVGTDIVYSNGFVIGRIDASGAHPLGVPKLSPEPSASATGGGSLPAGKFLVCAVAVNADGEESGTTTPVQLDVPANGVITLSGFPAALVRVYMSELNGATLYSTGSAVSVGAGGSITISVLPTLQGRCQTLLLAQMPAGPIVRWFNGKLLVASGSTLIYSEPYAPALYNPARNYIPFPAPITMVEPCEDGVYIGADQTYWLADPLEASPLQLMSPYRAVPRSSGRSPDSVTCFWMSTNNGLVIGKPGGSVDFPQQPNVAVPPARAGATFYRNTDGMKQLVSSLFGTDTTNAAANTFMDAEIVRKGTTL